MHALVLEDFNTMTVQERPDPTAGPGEVLLAVLATGICGSDLHGFTGKTGRRVPGQIMGHETVARVVSVGDDVHGLEVGALATLNPVVVPEREAAAWAGREHHHPDKYVIGVRPDVVSAFAQLIVVPARNVVPLPTGMQPEHGALVEPVAVAVHAARRVDASAATSALIVGGGPIGQSLVLTLARAGVTRILVTEVDPARRDLIARLGATPLDPTSGPVSDQVRAALGDLADVAFDAVGVSATVADALSSTRLGGAVCLVGMGQPRLDLDAFTISTMERSIVGSFTYSSDDFRAAVEIVAGAPDIAAALISRIVPLSEAPEAFTSLASGDGTPGKVLVRMSAT
ncbi:zinc-dependent alcohol dehydrogenase [Pengzhenrongella sp.]|jgi:L-iditol 2-dehydrogenase|uniref:zinc-dependent alcohol dehydrogenase n=1 Tax=Pengzhenrongella sp. TaxID=2888820 RepID=UPI002F93FC09